MKITFGRRQYIAAKPYQTFYEGENKEGDGKNAGGDNKEGNDTDDDIKGKTTFTQDDVNKILAKDRRKHQDQLAKQQAETQKQIQLLEKIQQSKNLTEKDKTALEEQIEGLRNTLLTEKELAQKERAKIENQHKTAVAELTSERDNWQRRFQALTINHAIISEATKAEAFDPEAIIAILGPRTQLSERIDPETGKGSGTFEPVVKFDDVDKDQKPITLDLTVEQAIKRMTEIPKNGYLFKSTAAKGLGASGSAGKSGPIDYTKMDPEQYMKLRKEGKI